MSPHRRSDSPVESVELKVFFRADPATSRMIKERIPTASVKDGGCRVSITGESPSEVAAAAMELFEKIRDLVDPAKDFNQQRGSRKQA